MVYLFEEDVFEFYASAEENSVYLIFKENWRQSVMFLETGFIY